MRGGYIYSMNLKMFGSWFLHDFMMLIQSLGDRMVKFLKGNALPAELPQINASLYKFQLPIRFYRLDPDTPLVEIGHIP